MEAVDAVDGIDGIVEAGAEHAGTDAPPSSVLEASAVLDARREPLRPLRFHSGFWEGSTISAG
jgi:hypothetical protein